MKALLTAFSKAQAEFATVKKDAKNPAFKSSYASLGSVQEATFDALAKHGLCILQSAHTSIDEQGRLIAYVGASLYHVESGEHVEQLLGLPVVKSDPQGVGSAITYGRRYVLMTLLGLVPDDDDGSAASTPQRPAQAQRPAAPPPARTAPDDVDLGMGDSRDDAPAGATLLGTLHGLGRDLYGDTWDDKRHELVRKVTKSRTASSKELTNGEAMRLIEGMGEKLRAQQAAQPALVTAPAGNGYN